MNFIFPTEYGYQFGDELKAIRAEVLEILEPNSLSQRDDGHLSPLLIHSYLGKIKFLPRCKVIFILGFYSHDIDNSVHRGSHSFWVLAKIVSVKVHPSDAYREKQFKELLLEFKSIVKDEDNTNQLYSAIEQNIIKDIGSSEVTSVINNLDTQISLYIQKNKLISKWKDLTMRYL